MTSESLQDLQIKQLPLPTANEAKHATVDFIELNKMLQASPFVLHKPPKKLTWNNLLGAAEGIYIIHSHVTHSEDWEIEYAEVSPHYIVYNAGTRVMMLYPEVLVVTDADIVDPTSFYEKLRGPPFCTLY